MITLPTAYSNIKLDTWYPRQTTDMGVFDGLKAFVHSITTDDHYALYESPYRHSIDPNSSAALRLNTINNSSSSLQKVGYRPGLRLNMALQLTVNFPGDVPLQQMDAHGNVPLPSIDSLGDRIEAWLEHEYPELGDALNLGVTTADLDEFEQDLRCGRLPEEFRLFYKRHDGQMTGGKPTGLIMGLSLLDLEGIAQESFVWRRVEEHLEETDAANQIQNLLLLQSQRGLSSADSEPSNSFTSHQMSVPQNSIQPVYYHPGWVPFIKDGEGNQLAIDLVPGSAGSWGQIILFGRDYDTKLVVAPSFHHFIFEFVHDIDAGNYCVDALQQEEESGFLLISRNDEYMIGDDEEGQGDLLFHDRDGKEFGGRMFRDRINYLDVLKMRALKRNGLDENYNTAFVPPNYVVRSRAILNRNSLQRTSLQLNIFDLGPILHTEAIIVPKSGTADKNSIEIDSKDNLNSAKDTTKDSLKDELHSKSETERKDATDEMVANETTISTDNIFKLKPETIADNVVLDHSGDAAGALEKLEGSSALEEVKRT